MQPYRFGCGDEIEPVSMLVSEVLSYVPDTFRCHNVMPHTDVMAFADIALAPVKRSISMLLSWFMVLPRFNTGDVDAPS